MSDKTKLNTKDLETLHSKLERLNELESKKQELKKQDVELIQSLKPLKSMVMTEIPEKARKINMALKDSEIDEFQTVKVEKYRQRLPTMELIYSVIEEELGKQALEDIKLMIKNKRQEQKSQNMVCSIKKITFNQNSSLVGTKRKMKSAKIDPNMIRYSRRKHKP